MVNNRGCMGQSDLQRLYLESTDQNCNRKAVRTGVNDSEDVCSGVRMGRRFTVGMRGNSQRRSPELAVG